MGVIASTCRDIAVPDGDTLTARCAANDGRQTVNPTQSELLATLCGSVGARAFRIALLVSSFIGFAACDAHDSDYYPYSLSALDAWVYDEESGRNLYAGRTEASYFAREEAALRCRKLAFATAGANNLRRWGYVCCTVTSSSECVTKVR